MTRAISALEGEYRLVRITKIKRAFYIVQAVTIVVLTGVLMSFSGASLKPLFIPVNSFIFYVLLAVLFFALAIFYFRSLEIRFNTSGSSKFLMAKNSQRKAMILIVISLVVALLILAPPIQQGLKGYLQESSVTLSLNQMKHSFNTRDTFGLTTIASIKVRNLDTDRPIEVYVLEQKYYDRYLAGDDSVLSKRINFFDYQVQPMDAVVIDFTLEEYKEMVIFVDLGTNSDAIAKVTFNVELAKNFALYAPILLLSFAGVNGVFFLYLQPIKKRYATDSIYT